MARKKRKIKKKKKAIKKEKKEKNRVTERERDKQNTIKLLTATLFVLLLVFVSIIVVVWYSYDNLIEISEENKSEEIEFKIKQPLFNATQATTLLPAIDKEGNGVLTLLVVEAVPGSGRTLVDIDSLLFWDDTQHSIRIAKKVAEDISGIDADNYDFVYNIYANASVIGGESAGAAITIATISVMENKKLRDDVVITGTVNHDGTIGPVQAILPKAKAAGEAGANIFLVPLLQGQEIVYETQQHCEKFGPTEYCTTEQVPRKVNISEETGIEVIEVGTIEEALKYFFEEQE